MTLRGLQIFTRQVAARALESRSYSTWNFTGTGLERIGNDPVYVALSSGVDSSTAACLLAKHLGSDRVKGVFMANWSADSKCLESDWKDVQAVANHAGIECHRVDLEKDYWTDVFEPMIDGYRAGKTPNPDVGCNRYVKFGALVDHLRAKDPHFKWLATGHYAGIKDGLVCRPFDLKKDQSYYLSTVSPDQLSSVVFPLAGLAKPQVRELAAAMQVPTAQKPDSQGLCFVEQKQRGFHKFLAEYVDENKGPIETADGEHVGYHNGLWTATVGQRTSFSMPQANPAYQGSWFVCEKDVGRNLMVICRGRDNPRLFHDRITTKDFVWHSEAWGKPLKAQFRSLMEPVDCTASEDGSVVLAEKKRAIAPGQYLVLYDDDKVVGSGEILRAYSIY